APTDTSTLSLHDALPIFIQFMLEYAMLNISHSRESYRATLKETENQTVTDPAGVDETISEVFAPYELPPELVSQLTNHLSTSPRSEEHTSELQSRFDLVC